MNRAQARAILDNLDLIQHFADGGEIGHRMHDYTGTQVAIYPTQKILLSNIESGGLTNYCKVKKRLTISPASGAVIWKPRYWPEKISEREIIPRGVLTHNAELCGGPSGPSERAPG